MVAWLGVPIFAEISEIILKTGFEPRFWQVNNLSLLAIRERHPPERTIRYAEFARRADPPHADALVIHIGIIVAVGQVNLRIAHPVVATFLGVRVLRYRLVQGSLPRDAILARRR